MPATLPRIVLRIGAFVLVTAAVAGALRYLVPPDNVGPDFIQFYTAGSLLAQRENPYDPKLQASVQRQLGWNKADEGLGLYDFMPFYYPPWLGLAAALLVPLGYPLAKMTWIVLAGEAIVASALLIGRTVRSISAPVAIGVAVLFAFSIKSVAMGQVAPFVVFFAALAWWLLDRRRDAAAGVALALLTIKPQLTLLVVAALLLWCIRRGRRAVAAGFVATLAVLSVASTAAYPGWIAAMVRATDATPMPTKYFPGIGTTWYSVLEAVGVHDMALVVSAAVVGALFVVALMELAIRRDTALADIVALGLLAPFFVVPYARSYDFPVLLVPALAIVGSIVSPMSRALFIATLTVIAGLHITVVATNWQPAIVGVRRPEFLFFWIPLVIASAWLLVGARRNVAAAGVADAPGT